LIYTFRVHWLVPAALGNALTAIAACAGLLAGVWFMARGSRRANDAGTAVAVDEAPPAAAPPPAADPDEPPHPRATTFRQGAIRFRSEPATEDAAPAPAPEPAPDPAPAPAAELELPAEPEPPAEPEAEAPAQPEAEAPPPPAPPAPARPQVPSTSFRQGRIRLGGLQHGGPSPADDEPRDEG
jgi:hypothetical protein